MVNLESLVFQVAVRSLPFDEDDLSAQYRAARFSVVAERLDAALEAGTVLPGAMVLLRARVMVRTDAPQTIGYLTATLGGLGLRDRAEATMLLAIAHGRSGDDRTAEAMFARAATLIRNVADAALGDELRYHVGFMRWRQGRLDEAQRAAGELATTGSIDVAIRAKILTSLVFASRKRHREEAIASYEAFELAQTTDNVELTAIAARNVSTIVRELPLAVLRGTLRDRVEAIPWTAELRDLQFKTLKAVAWCCALDGDYLNGFRLLKAATKAAPSDHWRVMAALDRSYLARCLDEPRWAEQELLDARELADQLDWRCVTGEEHVALALLAELYSAVDPAVSLEYLARFHEVARSLDPNLSFAHDGRGQAIADYSAGVAYARLDNQEMARDAFQSAWRVFDAAGYDWRAGRCARELYALTGRRMWLERARTKLAAYRSTWLASGLFEQDAIPLERLTPAQRRVFELLVAGLSTDDIVATLGRSVFTVRNQHQARSLRRSASVHAPRSSPRPFGFDSPADGGACRGQPSARATSSTRFRLPVLSSMRLT